MKTTPKTRNLALLSLAASAALAFTGCSSAPPEPAPSAVSAPPSASTSDPSPVYGTDSEPMVFGQGDFFFVSAENVVGKFTIPGEPVARIEALRGAVGADPVSYLTVKLDARMATDGANMLSLTLYDPDGKKYVFAPVDDALEAWRDRVDLYSDSEADVSLYNRFIDAQNAEPYFVDKAEVGSLVMTSSSLELPTEITRVAVQPLGMFDETEALPVSMGEGLDLDF